jgi:hypothetical protein
LTDEERIVPKWIIKDVSELDKVKILPSLLNSLEDSYQNKDANNIIVNTSSLLEYVLSLDSDLKRKRGLKGKILSLLENDDKLNKFGISKDVIIALNTFRVIRNEKIAHKKIPIKYNIPIIVSVSFASLVIFFLECLILNGEIIERGNNK